MKIKLSKNQWEQIGNKTGWMKKAQEFGGSQFPIEPKYSKLLNKISKKYLDIFDIKPLMNLKRQSGVITSDIYTELEKQFPVDQYKDLYKKYPFPTGMENAASIVVARLRLQLSSDTCSNCEDHDKNLGKCVSHDSSVQSNDTCPYFSEKHENI